MNRLCLLIVSSLPAIIPTVGFAQERPAVSWISQGVKGGETFLICGGPFQPHKTTVFSWIPDQPAAKEWKQPAVREASLERFLKAVAPHSPPKDAQRFAVIGQSADTLAVRPQSNKITGSQVSAQMIWVGTPDGLSDPAVVNKPIIWWSTPEFPAPGGLLRVFGRNLNSVYGAGRSAILRDAKGKLRTVEWGTRYVMSYDTRLTPEYEFDLRLPSDLPAGRYELYLHNGSGGDWGWSEPHIIQVRPHLAHPEMIAKAKDYGAIGDGHTDDSAAIQRAMDELSKGGGGVVQLGPGTFLLKQTLQVPAGVTLRGSGEHSTRLTVSTGTPFNASIANTQEKKRLNPVAQRLAPLVVLENQCGLDGLTIEGIQNTICALIGGEGEVKQISIRDVAFVNHEPVWDPNGEYLFSGNCVVLSGPIEGLQIVHSRFEGEEALYGLPGLVRRAVIEGSYFQSYPPEDSDLFVLRQPVECLVENNFFMEGRRGIVIQGIACHNVFSRNTVEHVRRGNNAGEMELWEISGAKSCESIKTAGSDWLTGGNARWKTNVLAGWVCLLLDGRGLGQYRLVKANTQSRLMVDRPWKFVPNAGERFMVTPAAVENLILNDTDREGDAALEFWGTAIGNVVAGEIMRDTGGAVLHGSDSTGISPGQGDIRPCWFNDFRQLRFLQGALLNLNSSCKPKPSHDDTVPLIFGNTIRECTFGDGPRLSDENQWWPFWEGSRSIKRTNPFDQPGWEAAITISGGSNPDDSRWTALNSRTRFNIVERNYIEQWPVGIYEARSAANNILAANQIWATKTNIAVVGAAAR